MTVTGQHMTHFDDAFFRRLAAELRKFLPGQPVRGRRMITEQPGRRHHNGPRRARGDPLARWLDGAQPGEQAVVVRCAVNTKAARHQHYIWRRGLVKGRVDPAPTADSHNLTTFGADTHERAVAETSGAKLSKSERECLALIDRHTRKDHECDLHGFSVPHANP